MAKKRYFLTGNFGKKGKKDYEVDSTGAPIKRRGKNVFLSNTKGFTKWDDSVKASGPKLEKKSIDGIDVGKMLAAQEAAKTKKRESAAMPKSLGAKVTETYKPEPTKLGGISGKSYTKGEGTSKYKPSKEVSGALIDGTPTTITGKREDPKLDPMDIKASAVKRAKAIVAAREPERKAPIGVDAITKADDPERFSKSGDYGDVYALDPETGKQYNMMQLPQDKPKWDLTAAADVDSKEYQERKQEERAVEHQELKDLMGMSKEDIEFEYKEDPELKQLMYLPPLLHKLQPD